MLQTGADRAVGDFLLGQFVAGVTVAAAQLAGLVRLEEADVTASADGSELLAFLPVTDQLAIDRVTDGRRIELFEFLANLARRTVAVDAAGLHRLVLLETGHPVFRILGLERGAEHLVGFLGVLSARCFNGFLSQGRRCDGHGQPE